MRHRQLWACSLVTRDAMRAKETEKQAQHGFTDHRTAGFFSLAVVSTYTVYAPSWHPRLVLTNYKYGFTIYAVGNCTALLQSLSLSLSRSLISDLCLSPRVLVTKKWAHF